MIEYESTGMAHASAEVYARHLRTQGLLFTSRENSSGQKYFMVVGPISPNQVQMLTRLEDRLTENSAKKECTSAH